MPNLILTEISLVANNELTTVTRTITATYTQYAGFMAVVNNNKEAVTTASAATATTQAKNSQVTQLSLLRTSAVPSSGNTTLILALTIPLGIVFVGIAISIWWYYTIHKKKKPYYLKKFETTPPPESDDGNDIYIVRNLTRSFSTVKRNKERPNSQEEQLEPPKEDHSSSSESEKEESYRQFGPIETQWISTPYANIKGWLNRKSIQGVLVQDNYGSDGSDGSDGSLSTGPAASETVAREPNILGLRSPAVLLRSFKLLRGKPGNFDREDVESSRNKAVVMPTTPAPVYDPFTEPQILHASNKKVPLLSLAPARKASAGGARPETEICMRLGAPPVSRLQPSTSFCNTEDTPIVEASSDAFLLPTPRMRTNIELPLTTPAAAMSLPDPIYIVTRPCRPTLQDEVSLELGDTVVVLREFADQWAMVEKLVLAENNQLQRAVPSITGMAPICCLARKN